MPPDGLEGTGVFFGLGSNLGDREGFLRGGLAGLVEGGLELEGVSAVVESAAIGFEKQPPFLNVVVGGRWRRGAVAALELIRRIEAGAGRVRLVPNGPRTLDVDLILFGQSIIRKNGLRVPHPRWKERSFVVMPLRELAPELVDPESGFTVDEISRFWPQAPGELERVAEADTLLGMRDRCT